MKRILFITTFFLFTVGMEAQKENKARLNFLDSLNYSIEMQGGLSKGNTPLWLNSNKYGLSSLDEKNGYLRTSVERPLHTDIGKKWGIGYGVDLVVPYNYTSDIIIQQAYAQLRWFDGSITVGSKQYPMELKNNMLSSGSQTLGINARPVPQVRLALQDYFTLPFGNGWLHFKGHIAYGKMTDDNWQHDFTSKQHKYADDVLYHSKAGYLKIGNEERFFPLSIELGLEMAATFGGTAYARQSDGTMVASKGGTSLKDYWHAFVPSGADINENKYVNVEGDHLGSWLFRVNYDTDRWLFSFYGDKFFEDHSAMFQLDYDGYETGDNWQAKKKHRFFLYDFKDMMLGMELKLKFAEWLQNIVFEYMYTKYQSGPIYHDHTPTIADHVAGIDDYYNHSIYTGWQHWGMVMGNPLYRSPIYNEDGTIEVKDNRFMAFHLGFSGSPVPNINYRVLASYQEGLGTYNNPYNDVHHNFSCLVEVDYAFRHGWDVKGGYGMDLGKILGNNYGFQLTISKKGLFKK
jgi:hypothetical protein